MTMRSLGNEPEAWRPSPGYFVAAVSEQTEAKALKAINDEADEYWDEWWDKCDRLMRAEVPTFSPEKRLIRYQQKPVMEAPPVPPLPGTDEKGNPVLIEQQQPMPTGSWMGQKIDFPNDFQEDMEDWVKLEPVSMRRDQVWREIAGFEMLAAAQQAGTPPQPLPVPEPTSGETGDLPPLPWTAQQPPAGV